MMKKLEYDSVMILVLSDEMQERGGKESGDRRVGRGEGETSSYHHQPSTGAAQACVPTSTPSTISASSPWLKV